MDSLEDQLYDGIILAGRFETISPLNHGSFGMVFMAKDLETNEVVAIKRLTKKNPMSEANSISIVDDDDSHELKCHALLGSHPNIVNLIRSFETDAHIYLVLEFCSRGDLYEAIRTSTGPLQTEHVRQFMLQLVNAVDYIHSKGLYHRDIKPENIFLAKSGEMKLGDFGLATMQKWTYEIMVGSNRYMAPEQYDSAGAGYAPEKVDIWAIGICLLNILFSRNPFTAPTESDPLFLDFSRDMQSLFDVFPTMSQDTFEVILKCMSLDPRKRSLDGAREALERLVSFTTADEVYDDFLMAERRGIACANRQPLRTPSIQSPQNELADFHWTKELHTTAHPLSIQRHTFTQSDDESYSEDLFPKSDEENRDWFSDGQQSPSLKSVLGSTFEASARSLAMPSPSRADDSSKINLSFHSTSLPTYLASMFGSNSEAISKSWSDLWEEEEEEADNQIKACQSKNSNSWRRNSNNDKCFGPLMGVSKESTDHLDGSSEKIHGSKRISHRDIDLVTDDIFFQEIDQERMVRPHDRQLLLPVNEQNPVDKWCALGERRRAHTGPPPVTEELKLVRKLGNLEISGTASGSVTQYRKVNLDKMVGCKGRAKGYPWSRGQAENQQVRSRKRLHDSGDHEWVGSWEEPHM